MTNESADELLRALIEAIKNGEAEAPAVLGLGELDIEMLPELDPKVFSDPEAAKEWDLPKLAQMLTETIEALEADEAQAADDKRD